MKYHALLVIFEKAAKFKICSLLQIVGGTLRVNLDFLNSMSTVCFWSNADFSNLAFCLA